MDEGIKEEGYGKVSYMQEEEIQKNIEIKKRGVNMDLWKCKCGALPRKDITEDGDMKIVCENCGRETRGFDTFAGAKLEWYRMNREPRREILQQAINCVCNDRQGVYGSPEDNFKVIAELWSDYLGIEWITPSDVAVMMILFKAGRIATAKKYHRDNFVDIAGYAACGGECAEREQEESEDDDGND